MKKTLFFIVGLGLALTAKAQIKFGLKAGYNNSSLSYSGPAMSFLGANSGFNAGIFASVPLSSTFYLQPEALYSEQGSDFRDSIPETTSNNYLNIPVLIKYQHASGLFAETGPQIGFLLNAHLETYGQSYDSKSDTQTTDFAWVFGLGYKIPVVNLGLDLRYNLGITNIVKSNYYVASAKNSVFQLDLFYQLKML